MNFSNLCMTFILAFFILYYPSVAYIAFHPNVSDWYESYYIKKSTTISKKEKKYLSPITLGEVYNFNDKRIGFDGWSQPEDQFRSSDGKSVKIVFILAEHSLKEVNGRIIIHFSTHGSQSVKLSLNGHDVFCSGVYLGSSVIDVSFPKHQLRSGENQLSLILPDAHAPQTRDRRILGLMLKSLVIY